MSTNVSKAKREQLVAKIKAVKSYIASAPQDENTARLLAYIADIEKDVKGKKYGLVFEEHREAIDEILEQNTPVLTEEKDLFIDNGGQMNFLIEGDNLAALQLLEKTVGFREFLAPPVLPLLMWLFIHRHDPFYLFFLYFPAGIRMPALKAGKFLSPKRLQIVTTLLPL